MARGLPEGLLLPETMASGEGVIPATDGIVRAGLTSADCGVSTSLSDARLNSCPDIGPTSSELSFSCLPNASTACRKGLLARLPCLCPSSEAAAGAAPPAPSGGTLEDPSASLLSVC